MKQLFAIFLMAGCLMLVSCRKERDTTVNAHFYLSGSSQTGLYTLYLNGEVKGIITQPNTSIACGMPGIDSLTLSFPLKSGKYDVMIKNAGGEQVHNSDITVKENSVAGNCRKGGQGTSKSGECFLVELTTETGLNR